MTHQHHPKSPEAPKEGIKDALTRWPEKRGERELVKVEKGVEEHMRKLFKEIDREAEGSALQRREACAAIRASIIAKMMPAGAPTKEVSEEDARTLRQRATETGMPAEELALETLRKVNYEERT